MKFYHWFYFVFIKLMRSFIKHLKRNERKKLFNFESYTLREYLMSTYAAMKEKKA